MTDAPWYDYALTQRGILEGRGNADNPKVVAYYKDAGHPDVRHDSVPWCAAFVGACLFRTGWKPSGSLLARSYLNWGKKLQAPMPGCITVIQRGQSSFLGHVFFWHSPGYGLGGNQSDMVSIARFNQRAVLGYRWPVIKLPAPLVASTGEPHDPRPDQATRSEVS